MRSFTRLATGLAVVTAGGTAVAAVDLERQFEQRVRPFIERYCIGCHGGSNPVARFSLEPYSSLEAVVRDHQHWALVLRRLQANEMPPPEAAQPTPASRQQAIAWIESVRADMAQRNAGDPGPVPVRRLSNAEYNYTIRDLTGVDIRPTREFPVDPANPAGFDNSGESLSMSPALLSKYLLAAREVGDHLVLTPDGFGFAPHPMLAITDREKYTVNRIVAFYDRQPTDYADYFEAAWIFKHRTGLGIPQDTLAEVAKSVGVSSGYLPIVWRLLEGSDHGAGPVARLRAMWRSLPPPAKGSLEPPREACSAMRDFVVKIRKLTARQFVSPQVDGLAATSQPLMNWKLRQFASHRNDFDREALRMASDPPTREVEVPKLVGTGLGRNAEARAAALAWNARVGEPELIVPDGQRDRYEAAFARFSAVFPDAFYIRERGRFYPDDSDDKGRLLSAGYHNVMGFWRDDGPLVRMILDDRGKRDLDRLWDEFDFIADFSKRTWVQYYFNQSGEVQGRGRESGTERPSDEEVSASSIVFALRDVYLAKAAENEANDPVAPEAIRDHFQRAAEAMRSVERMRAAAEPLHLEALLDFAERAYRRDLLPTEKDDLLAYYRGLRDSSGLTHEEAIRDSVVSILMAPDFCYRLDLADSGAQRDASGKTEASTGRQRLSPYALANRLSYFLWSSMPDEELLASAATGALREPEILLRQMRRMLRDERSKGLATEFFGNWLDFRRFEQHNAVDRKRFPAFDDELRRSMFEEPVRFAADMIRNNRSVLDLLYGHHTFVNATLARHYGMPETGRGGSEWVRVENARQHGRGGLLPMSVFLTKNSPGLRTSPVLRGYWVVRRLLGETIPPPPAAVPELPADEANSEAPLRELLASHRANPACSACHDRFDSLGLAFEAYGPVGERRSLDLAGRPVDAEAVFPGGSKGAGLDGVLGYVRKHRQNDFLANFCRKMLAYALSRSLLLSDEPLVERMRSNLTASGYRFDALVETVVTSSQFLNRRSDRSLLAEGD